MIRIQLRAELRYVNFLKYIRCRNFVSAVGFVILPYENTLFPESLIANHLIKSDEVICQTFRVNCINQYFVIYMFFIKTRS